LDDLVEKYDELEKQRASGAIRDEEYKDKLWLLDKRLLGDPKDISTDGLTEFLEKVVTNIFRSLLPKFAVAFAIIAILYMVFFYYPKPPGISLDVVGSNFIPALSDEKEGIYRGLELLKMHSPERYTYVDTYVDTVEVGMPFGLGILGGKEIGYYEFGAGKTIRIVRGFLCPAHCSEEDWNGQDLLMAEIILHEACHSMQYHTTGDISEAPCYEMMSDLGIEVGPKLWENFEEIRFVYEHPVDSFKY